MRNFLLLFIFVLFYKSVWAQEEIIDFAIRGGKLRQVLITGNQKNYTAVKLRYATKLHYTLRAPDGKIRSTSYQSSSPGTYLGSIQTPTGFLFYHLKNGMVSIANVDANLTQNKLQQSEKILGDKEKYLARHSNGTDLILLTRSNQPFTFHLYRFQGGINFEKKSFLIEKYTRAQIPKLLKIKGAYINFPHIYFLLEKAGSTKQSKPEISELNKVRTAPSQILKFEWDTQLMALLNIPSSLESTSGTYTDNLHDKYLFRFTARISQMYLSVFDLETQNLVKKFTYQNDDVVDLLFQTAQENKRLDGLNPTRLRLLDMTKDISADYFEKDVDQTPNTLNILSKGNLSLLIRPLFHGIIRLDLRSDYYIEPFWPNLIRDSEENPIIEKVNSRFRAYLTYPKLRIIDNTNVLPAWLRQQMEKYITGLQQQEIVIGKNHSYYETGQLYFAYEDKTNRRLKVVVFHP